MTDKEAIKRCKKIVTEKFNLDYSIDNLDKEGIETVLNLLEGKEALIDTMTHNEEVLKEVIEKKDKIIDEIEDLCIRKGDDEGEEYGGVIVWNFACKIMDIIKKGK